MIIIKSIKHKVSKVKTLNKGIIILISKINKSINLTKILNNKILQTLFNFLLWINQWREKNGDNILIYIKFKVEI